MYVGRGERVIERSPVTSDDDVVHAIDEVVLVVVLVTREEYLDTAGFQQIRGDHLPDRIRRVANCSPGVGWSMVVEDFPRLGSRPNVVADPVILR
jgi:hypothetical protein